MYRKWKGVAALGMAAMIGCLMPMGTMMAAEDNQEAVQEAEAGTEADAAGNDETILDDNENAGEEEDAGDEVSADDENAGDEVIADDENAGDEVSADDVIASDEAGADDVVADGEVDADNDGNDGIAVMSEAEETATGGEEVQAASEAPVIDIKLNGQSCIYDLGGNIDYKYVNDSGPELELSAGTGITFYYYLDKNPGSVAMGAEDVEGVTWISSGSTVIEVLSSGKTYVVYVKVEKDGQNVYARSCGIVVDTEAPEVTGVTNGGTCPEGTTFKVEDDNLGSVTVNGKLVTPDADGNYQVTAANTSCTIIAKDKAGNETTCSVTVTARELEANGAISVSGTYALESGTFYKLGEGQWQVAGDKSVYAGGNIFYVGTDGNYSFTKR